MATNDARRKTTTLVPKLLMVCLGGWAIASFASVEAPDSVKLVKLERNLYETQAQVTQNKDDINKIKDTIKNK